MKPVGENDGHLNDTSALSPDPVSELDLEAVTVRTNFVQVDGGEGLFSEALEAAGGIAERHAGDELDVAGCAEAKHEASEGPVDHTDAIAVARAKHEVAVTRRFQEAWNVLRIVREITVHLENELVVALEGPSKTGAVGSAEAILRGPVQDVRPRLSLGEGFREGAGAVGRVVVYHQHIGLSREGEQPLREKGQILPFIVGGYDDKGPDHVWLRVCPDR